MSLRRTYTILLIVFRLGAVFALLSGVAHVDPYSKCLLSVYSDGVSRVTRPRTGIG